MKNIIILSIIIFVFVLSCGKDNPIVSTQSNGATNIKIDAQSNGSPLVEGRYYKLNATDSILISRLDFYVQNFVLNTSDSLTNIKFYSLFDSANIKYQFTSKIPLLTVNRLAFMAGLDSITNKTDPNTQSVSSPLGGTKNMYWVSWSKYRYVVLEGMIKTPDTTYNVSYHTGLSYRAIVDLAKSFQVSQGATQDVKIHLDVNKVFYPTSGTNIKYRDGETGAHAAPTEKILMDKFTSNFGNAFSVE